MALKFPQIPEGAHKAFSKGKRLMIKAATPKLKARFAKERATIDAPHRLYVMDVADIASGEGFANAKQIGWRYISDDSIHEVHLGSGENTFEFAEINQGVHVKAILSQLAELREHPRIMSRDYEVAMVIIPALYVIAVWLMDKDGEDIIIPVGPLLPELRKSAEKMYSKEMFIAALQKAAQKRLAFNDAPPESPQ
jgi:hypothetical protein